MPAEVLASRVRVDFVDANGGKAQQDYYLPGEMTDIASEALAELHLTIMDITDAAQVKQTLTLTSYDIDGVNSEGPYNTVSDKLTITAMDGSGQLHTVAMPAPREDLFLPDRETVDPDSEAWGNFKDQLFAMWKGTNGEAMTYIRAVRTQGGPKGA